MIPEWAGGRFVDFGAVHLVTTSALDALRHAGTPAEVRRLRPNLVLSLDREPAPGDHVRVGQDVTLRILVPTPRCAIPAAAQPGLEPAPELLRAIARHRTRAMRLLLTPATALAEARHAGRSALPWLTGTCRCGYRW